LAVPVLQVPQRFGELGMSPVGVDDVVQHVGGARFNIR
jgi:hypothetical protein